MFNLKGFTFLIFFILFMKISNPVLCVNEYVHLKTAKPNDLQCSILHWTNYNEGKVASVYKKHSPFVCLELC